MTLGRRKSRRSLIAYTSKLYFDSIMFTGEGMHLIAETGIDHVVLGTDYPFPWNTEPSQEIVDQPN